MAHTGKPNNMDRACYRVSKVPASSVLVSMLVLSLAFTAVAQTVPPPEWSDAVTAGGWWEDQVTDIAVDPGTGDVIVVGTFLYNLHLGPYVLSSVPHVTMGNASDIFVAKLSGSEWKWAVSAGGGDHDWANSIAIDSNGDAYVAGGFMSNNSSFDQFTLANADQTPRTGLVSQPTSDGFLAKISKEGNWQWVESFSGPGSEEVSEVSVGPNDKVVAAGTFHSSSMHFRGNKSLSNSGINGTADIFVIKLGSNGSHVWHTQVLGSHDEVVQGMAIHDYGDVMLTGYFLDQAAYFTPYKAINSKPGYSEAFVARLSPSGLWSWVAVAGGERGDEGVDLDVDSNGMTYVIGRFGSDSIGFRDPSNLSVSKLDNTVQVGSTDVFVAKLDGAGNWLWVVGIEGEGTDDAGGITVIEECGSSVESGGDAGSSSQSGCVTGAVVAGGFYSLSYVFGNTILQHSAATSHQDMYLAGISENGSWQWAISGGMAKWPEYFALENHYGTIHIAGSFAVGKVTLGEYDMHNWDENSTYQWPDGFVASLEYPPPPPPAGCTDSQAINWDPLAQVDDGSCEYDNDGDGIGDNSDDDDDDDGFNDVIEVFCDTDPLDSDSYPLDSDSDGICDFMDDDSDNDGLLDGEEIEYGTDPMNPDSDGDGFYDGDEVLGGHDPLDAEDYPLRLCCLPPSPLVSALPVILVGLLIALFLWRRKKVKSTESDD